MTASRPPRLATARVRVRDAEHNFVYPASAAMSSVLRRVFDGEYALPPLPGYAPDTVLDVGANVGAAALFFHNAFPAARVFCYEPASDNLHCLKRNAAPFENISVLPYGLSDRDAQVPLYHGLHQTAQHSVLPGPEVGRQPSETVRLVRASEELRRRGLDSVSVLKVDTEGCEVPILTDLLAAGVPIDFLLVEYHSEEDRRALDALAECDFVLARSHAAVVHRGICVYLARRLLALHPSLDACRIPRPTTPAVLPRERPRLLFCSYHGLLDPSSGAALATRDALELLARHDWACEALCGPRLDFDRPPTLEQLLSDHDLPFEARRCDAGAAPFDLLRFRQGGVPVTLFRPDAADPRKSPTREEGLAFLALLERLLDRDRPDVLLTYGGDWAAREVIALARRNGTRVVFGLHNFAYHDAAFFEPVDAVWVPSVFARDHYRRALGLDCTAIPYPLDPAKLRCDRVEGRYVTFVNPQPHKGVFVFARVAEQLWHRRPDIPLLVVEGRGGVNWLGRTGVDLAGVGGVSVMANTPDPRDFYRVSRLVLMPSLWDESFGRVAAEALLNGVPVLASDRGALPEVLAEAGVVLPIPSRYTPESRVAPTAEEVRPWVEAMERLWDDAGLYEAERRRCLAAAEAWHPDRLAQRYLDFFAGVARPRDRT